MNQPDMFGLPDDGQSLADRADQLDCDTGPKWASALVEMVDVLHARYMRRGMSDSDARAIARESVLELANHFGGRAVYLPRGDRLRIALRDAEIYRRMDGRNHDMLAAEYGLTTIHIYRICKNQHQLHRDRVQHRLPID